MSRRSRLEIELQGDASSAIRAAERTQRAYAGVGREVDSLGRKGRGGGVLGGLGGGLSAVGGAATVAAGGLAVAGGAFYKLTEFASDANEAASAAATIYGKSFPAIEKAAGSAAKTMGLSKTEYLDAAKTVGVLGQAAGLQGKQLSTFGTSIVGAAGDLASFNNTSTTEALDALSAGLRGEAEPLRRFGILMDDASLRQKALELGLVRTTKDALTPQQKTLAAQALIMSQLGAAQGDFARTSGGMANQQRILTAQLKDTAAELGQKLLPYAVDFLTWANKMVPKILEFAGSLGDTLGPIITTVSGFLGGLSRSTDSVTGSTSAAGQVVQVVIGHYRAMATSVGNFLRPAIDGGRRAVDSIRQALERNPRVVAALRAAFSGLMSGLRTAQTVMTVVAGIAGRVLGGALRGLGGAISFAIDLADRLIGVWQRARSVVSSAASAISGAARSVGGFFGFSAAPLALAGGALAGRTPGLATASTGGLIGATLGLGAMATGGAGGVYIDRRVSIRVDGALDPVAVGDQLRGILRDANRRDGRL